MTTVLLTIHFLISVGLVGTVLLQRSEGGALGIGGGPGSMMSGRGAANVLSRSTTVLGALFFLTSILLTVIPNIGKTGDSVVIGADVPKTTAPVETLPEPVTEPKKPKPQPEEE